MEMCHAIRASRIDSSRLMPIGFGNNLNFHASDTSCLQPNPIQ
jgi:hypothetical protein